MPNEDFNKTSKSKKNCESPIRKLRQREEGATTKMSNNSKILSPLALSDESPAFKQLKLKSFGAGL